MAETDIILPSSVHLSNTVTAIDNNSSTVKLIGDIEIIKAGNGAVFIHLPAMPVKNTMLLNLIDNDAGVFFRNNTLIVSLVQTSDLIMTVEDMQAKTDGYYGLVTGIIIDSGQMSGKYENKNITLRAVEYLNDYPEGAALHLKITDDADIKFNVIDSLRTQNITVYDIATMIEISGSDAESRKAIGYNIISLEQPERWLVENGNLSAYLYKEGKAVKIPCRIVTRENQEKKIIEVISNGPGTVIIAMTGPLDNGEKVKDSTGALDLAILGSILIALIISLILMLKRIRQRK